MLHLSYFNGLIHRNMVRDNRGKIIELQNTLAVLEGRINNFQKLTEVADGRFQVIQERRTEAGRLKNEIDALKQQAQTAVLEIEKEKTSASEMESSIEDLVESAEESKTTFDEQIRALEEIEGKIKKFEVEIVEQLGRAGSGALALAFTSRQEEVEEELERWRDTLYKATGALIVVAAILFGYAVSIKTDLQFILKLTVSFPFIYAVWFAGKQYDKERFILERYAFKAAQAKSLSAFSKTVKEMDESEEGQSATQQFVINSIEKIYIAPKLEGNNDEEFPMIKITEKLMDITKEAMKPRT